jgi:negative regulator of flagellin synthesis FlgM
MRIEPAHTTALQPQAERSRAASQPSAEPPRAADRLELSDRSREIQRAAEAAAEAADVRAERVAAIKQQIGDGSYVVDSTVLAEKLLNYI